MKLLGSLLVLLRLVGCVQTWYEILFGNPVPSPLEQAKRLATAHEKAFIAEDTQTLFNFYSTGYRSEEGWTRADLVGLWNQRYAIVTYSRVEILEDRTEIADKNTLLRQSLIGRLLGKDRKTQRPFMGYFRSYYEWAKEAGAWKIYYSQGDLTTSASGRITLLTSE
jgi:hypothetical protein